MSLVHYAKAELARINTDRDEMQNMMDRNILEIIEKFSEQGHSGFSASYAISFLQRLLNWKPLTPLTGEDDEWNDGGEGWPLDDSGTLQNKRCSAVFKRPDGTAYYIEGKVFSDDGGKSWYTSKDSHIPVEFPFTVPDKPEYIILK